MKIRQHPRMQGIQVGDEVYSHLHRIVARVAELFPAAVCVKIATLSVEEPMALTLTPQLWPADDIENLSVCRYCGRREQIRTLSDAGIPFQVCHLCAPLTGEESATGV